MLKETYAFFGMSNTKAVKYAKMLSFGEFNFSMQKLSFTNLLARLFQDVDLKKYKMFNLIKTTEIILQTVLPGIHRIKENFDYFLSYQSVLYNNAYSYAEYCLRKKNLLYQNYLIDMLNFRSEQKSINFSDWVPDHQWLNYLDIMFKSYLFFNIIKAYVNGESKNIDQVKHVVGMMYYMRQGYFVIEKVHGIPIKKTVIPQDIYLNKIGVMHNFNKMIKKR